MLSPAVRVEPSVVAIRAIAWLAAAYATMPPNEHLDAGHSIRSSLFRQESWVHTGRGIVAGDWDWCEHLHLQRCKRVAVPSSAVRQTRTGW